MDRATFHRVKLRVGIGIATYEAIALAVDDPTVLPCITYLCHPQATRPAPRLALALLCAGWTAMHLLRPWIPRR